MIKKALNNPYSHRTTARRISSLRIHKQTPYYIFIFVSIFILCVAIDIGWAEKFIIAYLLTVILIRPDVKYSVAVSIVFIILIPLEQAMGQTIAATQSAIIAFWSICFGLLLAVLNVMAPHYAHQNKNTVKNDAYTSRDKDESVAKEQEKNAESDTKQDANNSTYQPTVKASYALQQPASITTKQEARQHPQAKPPTKRKLIQG